MLDLFLHTGRHITFDGHVHMTTMAQFAQALKDGEFPVAWSNNFANYGLPLPLFAHQLPAYLGAILILLGLSVVTAYNLNMFLAVISSSFLFYIFSRKYAKPNVALAASIFMSLFPYRIINIYIRGALPEILATVLLPLLLIGIYQLNVAKNIKGGLLILSAVFLLAITHPMLLLVFALPAMIYFVITLEKDVWLKQTLTALMSVGIGLLLAAYYLVPLILEMKYFYQGTQTAAFNTGDFFQLRNFIDPNWYYFYSHPGPRGHVIKLGLPEFIIVLLSSGTALYSFIQKKTVSFLKVLKSHKIFFGWLLNSLIAILLLLPFSEFIYQRIPLFLQLQYPWRFLAALQFSIPLLFLFVVNHCKFLQNKVLLLMFVAALLILRIPQLYGKNYVTYSEQEFYFTESNLHSQNLNTIWTGPTEDYPIKNKQAEIIEGAGHIETLELKNASRQYKIKADSQVRVVDYTFYFPGWEVIADKKPLDIQFQDPNYRGVITYFLDPGEYLVEVNYKPTKIRAISRAISILGLVLAGVWCYILFAKSGGLNYP